MAKFGHYEIERELHHTPDGYVARATLGGAGDAKFAVKVFEPAAFLGDLRAAGQTFVTRARLLKALSAANARRWIRVYEFTPDDAQPPYYYVADLHPRSAQALVERKIRVSADELGALVGAVLQGLWELKSAAGRPHGCLKPENVLLRSRAGDVGREDVLLTDPASDAEAAEGGETEDLRALGGVIYELVTHRPSEAASAWPVQPTADWSRLGRKPGEAWRTLCNRLMHPVPAERPAGLEALAEELTKLGYGPITLRPIGLTTQPPLTQPPLTRPPQTQTTQTQSPPPTPVESEQERTAREERERLERERLARLEQERQEKEREAQRERERQAQAERERLERERQERERLAQIERERQEKEREETERLARERQAQAERERQAQLERDRLAKLEKERQEKERRERERLERERLAQLERERQAQLERERLEREKREREERERQKQEKLAREKDEKEKKEWEKRERAEQKEREKREKEEQKRLQREAAERKKQEQQAEKERLAAQQRAAAAATAAAATPQQATQPGQGRVRIPDPLSLSGDGPAILPSPKTDASPRPPQPAKPAGRPRRPILLGAAAAAVLAAGVGAAVVLYDPAPPIPPPTPEVVRYDPAKALDFQKELTKAGPHWAAAADEWAKLIPQAQFPTSPAAQTLEKRLALRKQFDAYEGDRKKLDEALKAIKASPDKTLAAFATPVGSLAPARGRLTDSGVDGADQMAQAAALAADLSQKIIVGQYNDVDPVELADAAKEGFRNPTLAGLRDVMKKWDEGAKKVAAMDKDFTAARDGLLAALKAGSPAPGTASPAGLQSQWEPWADVVQKEVQSKIARGPEGTKRLKELTARTNSLRGWLAAAEGKLAARKKAFAAGLGLDATAPAVRDVFAGAFDARQREAALEGLKAWVGSVGTRGALPGLGVDDETFKDSAEPLTTLAKALAADFRFDPAEAEKFWTLADLKDAPDDRWKDPEDPKDAARKALWDKLRDVEPVKSRVARLDGLREVLAMQRPQLAAAAKLASPQSSGVGAVERALAAWERLSDTKGTFWPNTVEELRSDEAIRSALAAALATKPAWASAGQAVEAQARENWARFTDAAVATADALEARMAASWALLESRTGGPAKDLKARKPSLDVLGAGGRTRGLFNLLLHRTLAEATGGAAAAELTDLIQGLKAAARPLATRPEVKALVARQLPDEPDQVPVVNPRPPTLAAQVGPDQAITFVLVETAAVRPFYLARTEVSVGQFKAVVNAALGATKPLIPKVERGARGWEWDGDGQFDLPRELYWFPDAPDYTGIYPLEFLRDRELGGDNLLTNKLALHEDAGGRPTLNHPVQQVPAQAALYFAATVNWSLQRAKGQCRLPTGREWQAAFAAREAQTADEVWNLRDRPTWAAMIAHHLKNRGANLPWPDEGMFAWEDPRRRQDPVAAWPRQTKDGAVFFRPVEPAPEPKQVKPDVQAFYHLVGNVAEFVCDAPGEFDAAAGANRGAAVPAFVQGHPKDFAVIGGSALSPQFVDPKTPYDVPPTQPFTDVGFRLAVTAPAESFAEYVRWELENPPYILGAVAATAASAERPTGRAATGGGQ